MRKKKNGLKIIGLVFLLAIIALTIYYFGFYQQEFMVGSHIESIGVDVIEETDESVKYVLSYDATQDIEGYADCRDMPYIMQGRIAGTPSNIVKWVTGELQSGEFEAYKVEISKEIDWIVGRGTTNEYWTDIIVESKTAKCEAIEIDHITAENKYKYKVHCDVEAEIGGCPSRDVRPVGTGVECVLFMPRYYTPKVYVEIPKVGAEVPEIPEEVTEDEEEEEVPDEEEPEEEIEEIPADEEIVEDEIIEEVLITKPSPIILVMLGFVAILAIVVVILIIRRLRK